MADTTDIEPRTSPRRSTSRRCGSGGYIVVRYYNTVGERLGSRGQGGSDIEGERAVGWETRIAIVDCGGHGDGPRGPRNIAGERVGLQTRGRSRRNHGEPARLRRTRTRMQGGWSVLVFLFGYVSESCFFRRPLAAPLCAKLDFLEGTSYLTKVGYKHMVIALSIAVHREWQTRDCRNR